MTVLIVEIHCKALLLIRLKLSIQDAEEMEEKERQKLIEEMLNPLQEKVEEIRNDKANKETKLEEAKATLDGLLEKKTILEVQLEEVASLKNAI